MSFPHRLTAEQLRELVDYEPSTGKFYWREDAVAGFHGSVVMHRRGDVAGTPRKSDGRVVVRIGGRTYLGYRLAWLWMTGNWPIYEIDHIDGDATNNRFTNLRDASRRTNQENLRIPQRSKGSSRYLGVYANKPGYKKPWRAAITVKGKQKNLGYFMSEDEAYAAYVQAKRRLHEGCTL
jgi:hypothetical protein|tara:strand:+ start:2845 stop:3381 length:537 start_codon:yes stop_codon:yes gene_type:complete